MKPDASQVITQLDVFFGDEFVGALHDTAPLSFTYSETWLARSEPAQIAAIAPVAGRQYSDAIQAFFAAILNLNYLR